MLTMRRRLEKIIKVFPHVFSVNLSYILSNIVYRIFPIFTSSKYVV